MITKAPIETLPVAAAAEIDTIEAEIRRFLAGETAPERFRSFRLAHGIYGQRQPGVQMVRVKIPAGVLRARHLAALADAVDEYSRGSLHLTTRQDVQFYDVALERVPEVLRSLAAAGLTTREACGNSVRNVTSCPLTGVIADEAFAVRPYAAATYAFLVRNPFCQQMSRKFKIAFSACPEDCAATAIHDIGALGRVVVRDGRPRAGFRLVVGGGLGPTPFVAQVLSDFVEPADLLATFKAILLVFSEEGNRRQKAKARLKFVLHRLGIEAFRARVAEKLQALTPAERDEADLMRYVPAEDLEPVRRDLEGRGAAPLPAHLTATDLPVAHVPAVATGEAPLGPVALKSACGAPAEDAGFARFWTRAVRRHREPERAVVTVTVPLGDLTSQTLRSLAAIATRHAHGEVRIAREQNLVLPEVRRADLRVLYDALVAAGLGESSAGSALDVTSCPGADTCALGITSSRGLARAVRSALVPLAANGVGPALEGVTIKISGCPNSCGQHHIANIGLHGVAKTIDGKQVPAYQLHLGGAIGAGTARIGTALDKIPARRAPAAVAALLRWYGEERAPGETLPDFFARQEREAVHRALQPFTGVDVETAHLDWGATSSFSTDDLGTGECAGAGLDKAIDPFDNVRAELDQARRFLERGQVADAVANLSRSQYTLARVLLEALGRKPDSDYETACELRAKVIDRGHADDGWNERHRDIDVLLRTRRPHPETVRTLLDRATRAIDEAAPVHARLARLAAGGGAAAEQPT
jgi:sulfite reductase (ferredoxin)